VHGALGEQRHPGVLVLLGLRTAVLVHGRDHRFLRCGHLCPPIASCLSAGPTTPHNVLAVERPDRQGRAHADQTPTRTRSSGSTPGPASQEHPLQPTPIRTSFLLLVRICNPTPLVYLRKHK